MFAQVSFPISSFRSFTYKIPTSLNGTVQPGTCVNAPINRKMQAGFVVAVNQDSEFQGKILPIDSIREKELQFPEELWHTLEWISQYYITPLGQVLKAAVPNSFLKLYKPKQVQYVKITAKGLNVIPTFENKKPAQKRLLEALSTINEPVKTASLTEFASSPHTVCGQLEKSGFVETFSQPQITDPFEIMGPGEVKNIKLSKEQQGVVDTIQNTGKGFHPYLLHGITGSGKTEVYLKLAQTIVEARKSVLVLVPEIALTPQVATRFRKAFGSRVALWHSRMTKSEKGWTWQQLKKGKYSVVVGARSAIFAPLKNLGLIIVDEEQESSYKQENPAPRYHARDVAMVRGKQANAIVLLTSATPCLESYYNALQKKFTLLKLTKRYGKSNYPAVELVDMKKEYSENGSALLSKSLTEAINDRLEKSEQVIILQNRRGYSRVHQCLECGEIKKCENCSVALTFHKTDNNLHCHYCESVKIPESNCNKCTAENMTFAGSGTQRVEDVLQQKFPNADILRMDMDTVRRKGSHLKILEQFANGKADILLGTQMIAKGLDFENVTLVGVINADSGLFFPDFRSGERVFQLIYQVAGRAGRRDKPGMAIIQTYNPDDVYIQTAAALNTKKFYNVSLAQRQELAYPPFSRIGRILFTGENKLIVNNFAQMVGRKLQGNVNYKILGPAPAPLEKIKGNWRAHLIIKSKNRNISSLHQFIHSTIGFTIFERKWRGVRIQIDVDPVSML
ncbi:MAG: primosomal protein N' [Candidatus Marinimicrobia bacterium]|jgi:primosomal protein N' (replication factor Y)|nr:primosomal protein N' [Candidatus Neomarinimicrobiota bacterium]